MGLFSFIKSAGSKIFGKKKEEEVPVELSKIDALKAEVSKLGIPVEGLDLEICEQIIVHGRTNTTEDAEKIVLALGNVEGIGSVDDRLAVANPTVQAVFVEVKKGDTLGKIAKEQYGDAMKYPAIFEANKPMLSHPDKIYPGQILRIPQA